VTVRNAIVLFTALVGFAGGLSAQPERKLKTTKDKEPVTQTLEIPKEPPMAISAETGKLVFHVSPLSSKGLLSQQVRDALKALDRANGGATVVKLRAFVAGAGDLRRVAAIVSEEFSGAKLPLPVVSTIQVGALPLDGAQVVIESIGVDKKVVNPRGLAFFPAQSASQLRMTAQDSGASVLRITCFLSSLDGVEAVRGEVTSAFPGAALDFVQLTRLGASPVAACEAVGRRGEPRGDQGLTGVVQVSRPKLIFSGLQLAFSDQDSDIRLAFERMGKALASQGASNRNVVFSNIYALNRAAAAKASAIRLELMGPGLSAGTSQVFEGLPSLDATMAVEVVAGP
jgi:enamine deaminase RidA (YjgF/YER057c/UK114 family)